MAKKLMSWKTKGMNKDLSVSAFNPEFAFDNRNLRLSTNENNTLLSWVNEKGTSAITLTGDIIDGIAIGTAIINHTLVLFTTGDPLDHIYTLQYTDDDKTSMEVAILYEGSLKFDMKHPLETTVSYEAESIQKVYWVDGVNQPRVINIKGNYKKEDIFLPSFILDFIPELQLKETITITKKLGASGMFAPGVIQYAFTYYNKNGQETNIFYTSPLLYISYRDRGASPEDKVENAFQIAVSDVDTNFDYLRIYSIQRTSVNGTPICKRIQDIALSDINESSETINIATSTTAISVAVDYTNVDKQVGIVTSVLCKGILKSSSPNLVITTTEGEVTWGEDAESDWVIWITQDPIMYEGHSVYCIFQTAGRNENTIKPMSLSTSPSSLDTVFYLDTGMSGDSIDPTELLYKGGDAIIANTIEQKDGTLFLGNFITAREQIKEDNKPTLSNVSIIDTDSRNFYPTVISTGNYPYANQLTSFADSAKTHSVPCGGFKAGNIYRLGIQFQHKTGKWSDPIHIIDKQVPLTNRPSCDNATGMVSVPVFKGTLTNNNDTLIADLYDKGYRRVRAVVVYPGVQDRKVLCQGISCSTLYTGNHAGSGADNDLHAQSSWFFRPRKKVDEQTSKGTVRPEGRAQQSLPYIGSTNNSNDPNDIIRQVEVQGEYAEGNQFKIKTEIKTLHSPDIEFDDSLMSADFEGVGLHCAGGITFNKTLSDISIQTETPNISSVGGGFIHRSFADTGAYGIVSGLFYDDFVVADDSSDGPHVVSLPTEKSSVRWMVYLWNKTGSLNNDINRPANSGVATAVLKKKVISNLRIANTSSWRLASSFDDNTLDPVPQIFSSDEPTILKLGSNIYMGNIDTILTPDTTDGMYFAFDSLGKIKDGATATTDFTSKVNRKTYAEKVAGDTPQENAGIYLYSNNAWSYEEDDIGNEFMDLVMKKDLVRMKYKSTPHLVHCGNHTFPENADLAIMEIYKHSIPMMFGGDTPDALRENIWIPCGEPEPFTRTSTSVPFEWSWGDTYYQRYDCLKTYAYTKEDENQVVEIGSFMLETYVNIDGRYDRNRGQSNNLNMSPQNFNLINPVYSQVNNFFTYRILPDDTYRDTEFPNQITWSKTKESGADVDQWTNVTLASILELDGDKGKLNKLIRFNNYLFAFQDTGISQILYNDNVQISATDGVPIEIANSGKVQGKDYKSSTIGCSNKWSMTTTPNGIYFMDSHDKSVYLFNGQLQNISNMGGFSSWSKKNIHLTKDGWNPLFTGDAENEFVTYFDKLNQDVLFINKGKALAWSEKLQAFTSFYDYGEIPFFCNLDDTGIWIQDIDDIIHHGGDPDHEPWDEEIKETRLWKHQGAESYCNFFGNQYPYWMTLIGNPEPQTDKIFTNLEFRACVDGDGTVDPDTGKFTPSLPFDTLETWNEYQHGIANIINRNGHDLYKHHSRDITDIDSSLIRKFRTWRCDIPRSNASLSLDDPEMNIYRKDIRPQDRMRNPWLYLKLMKNASSNEGSSHRAEIHDIVMTYFN